MFVALCVPWVTWGQQQTVVVGSRQTTTYNSPLYYYMYSSQYQNQYIIPARMLTNIEPGSQIRQLTFHRNNDNSVPWPNTSFTVKLGEVPDTSFQNVTGMYDSQQLTTVLDGTFDFYDSLMVVTFSTPYIYMGGNLLYEITNDAGTGTSSYIYFYAMSRSNSGRYRVATSTTATGTLVSYLPWTEILYLPPTGCRVPNNIASSLLSAGSVTLSWQASGYGELGYQYVLVPQGQTPDWSAATSTTLYTATIDTLQGNTSYDFYIRSTCGTDSMSYAARFSFKTPCDFLTHDVHTWTFDDEATGSTVPFIDCWSRYNNTTSVYPYVYSSGGTNNSRCLYFYVGSSTNVQYAVLPPVMAIQNPIGEYAVSFKGRTTTAGGQMVVGAMTDPADPSTFTPIDTIDIGNETYSNMRLYTSYLNSYTGTATYIAIMGLYGSSYHYYYIDSVSLFPMPTCAVPSRVSLSSLAAGQITATWNSPTGNTTFNLRYRAVGETDWTTVSNISGTTYTITNLEGGVRYSVQVQPTCSSEWSNTTSIMTQCLLTLAVGEPYTTSFEDEPTGSSSVDTSFVNCWHRYNNAESASYRGYPYVYNYASYASSGTKSIYFYRASNTGT